MKRSIGVAICAVLFALAGLTGLASEIALKVLSRSPELPAQLRIQIIQLLEPGRVALAVVVCAVLLAVGVGLWLLKHWARGLALALVALSGLREVAGMISYLRGQSQSGGDPRTVGIALAVTGVVLAFHGLVLWYLLRPSVQAQFARSKTAAST